MTLREQPGVSPSFRRGHPSDISLESASRQRVGTSSGLHPEDRPYQTSEHRYQGPINRHPLSDEEDDDTLYNTRRPTSTRRYAPTTTPPRTVLRVTRHQGPPPIQRASLTKAKANAEAEQTRAHSRRTPHFSVLVYVGAGMALTALLFVVCVSFSQWWQNQQETFTYGSPRTFQVDADVKHGGVSHFTVENLNGHILIYEVLLNDVTKPHLYIGPVLSGTGADEQPATISFQDVNGDGYPDMIITVGSGRYLLINDHSTFRPADSSDTISGKGL